MGDSHYKSNLVAKLGSETITGFDKVQADEVVCGTLTATRLTIGTTMTVPSMTVSSYVKLGTRQYIFFGAKNTAATVVSAATALVGTPIKGSMYLSYAGAKPRMWLYMSDSSASPINLD